MFCSLNDQTQLVGCSLAQPAPDVFYLNARSILIGAGARLVGCTQFGFWYTCNKWRVCGKCLDAYFAWSKSVGVFGSLRINTLARLY